MSIDSLSLAKEVFDIEIRALELTKNVLDSTFQEILDAITSCKGKVIVTGMGKPGHIARKMAATFSSLGTPAVYVHPAEAMHGDLGMISASDVVIIISYSGESNEIIGIIPAIRFLGAKLIAITGNENSTLAKRADIVQILPRFEEACRIGLAPTSSTTVELVYGDALAVVASERYGFQESDFGRFHPAGALGRKLILRVADIMAIGKDIPKIGINAPLTDAIMEISAKGIGVVCVVNQNNELCGIITDGDIRRMTEKHIDIYSEIVEHVMTLHPFVMKQDILGVDALKFLQNSKINNAPILDDEGVLVGVINLQMIIRAGIVL